MRGWTLDASVDGVMDRIGVADAVKRGLFAAGNELINTWDGFLARPGSGVLYTEELRTLGAPGKRFVAPVAPRVPHRASVPGSPPAPDSGVGRDSLGSEFQDEFTNRVGSGAAHLAILEAGVPPGRHPADIVIEPRPHARPAADDAKPRMTAEMVRELATVGLTTSGFVGRPA